MPTRPSPRSPVFPSTRWSRILARPAERDLEELARAYWRPIRAWLGARLQIAGDEAEDLTQEAFAWMLSSRLLDRADPARGRFRGFLKTALARFAIQHSRRANAEKRGGGRTHEPFDATRDVAADTRTPDRVLDEAWRRELLEGTRDELQHELEASGRGTYFALFRDYFLDEDDEIDHRELARRYGITTTDVSNWLDHAKRRYRHLLRARVRETVSDAESLSEELQWLFGTSGAE